MALTVLGASGVVLSAGAWATQTLSATTWVNVRSGPGTSYRVLGTLSPAQSVVSASSQGGWYQVTTTSGLTGWVYKSYLKVTGGSSSSGAAQAATTGASGSASVTSAVNVRTSPSTSSTVVGVAAKGASVAVTGKTSGGWTEVVWQGANRWISTNYLTRGATSTSAVTGQVQTTASLYLRTGGSLSDAPDGVLPAKSVVDTTGKTTADYTEIVYKGVNRWIATRYTTAVGSTGPAAPSAPQATGSVTVTVGSLYVRATSAANGSVVATVYRGATLQTTGVTSGDRLQVIYQGTVRWVFKAYTSAGGGSASLVDGGSVAIPSGLTTSGISQLNSNAKTVFNRVVASYPQIRTIYGWRASSNWSSDHPNGRAVDVMIPNWSSQSSIDLGWEIANYFAANASTYNVTYIIYRQKQYNASYPSRGWRTMEDRGSATENHLDHVHISVKATS